MELEAWRRDRTCSPIRHDGFRLRTLLLVDLARQIDIRYYIIFVYDAYIYIYANEGLHSHSFP